MKTKPTKPSSKLSSKRTTKPARARAPRKVKIARQRITDVWIHCGSRVRSVTLWRGEISVTYASVSPSSIARAHALAAHFARQSAAQDWDEYLTFCQQFGIQPVRKKFGSPKNTVITIPKLNVSLVGERF